MTFATGIVATMALPAYAFIPTKSNDVQRSSSDIRGLSQAQAQTDTVSSTVAATLVDRDGFTVTAASVAPDAAAQRAAAAKQFAPSSPPPVVAAPSSTQSTSQALIRGTIFEFAEQFIGVPYVWGGASPRGFDCSGFVKYVYENFGIPLVHSAGTQGSSGTRIPKADAVPGDLVVFPSGHVGFFAGGDRMLDAPNEGQFVRIETIWSESHYFVRVAY